MQMQKKNEIRGALETQTDGLQHNQRIVPHSLSLLPTRRESRLARLS